MQALEGLCSPPWEELPASCLAVPYPQGRHQLVSQRSVALVLPRELVAFGIPSQRPPHSQGEFLKECLVLRIVEEELLDVLVEGLGPKHTTEECPKRTADVEVSPE